SDFSPLKIYDAKELTRNRFGTLLDAEQIESIAQRVERLINDDEFLGLVDGRCYKEQSLIFEKELRYIDLLVELQDGSYRVIDYKSSMGDMQEHTIQVKGYVDCVEKISQKSAEGYICYLLEDGIKIVKV
ncbi:MAG: RecB-like helicase, partial [Epsilonproteobacteria bacterium]|nr:RecB-like helicase [Campylobacterota bacterium]